MNDEFNSVHYGLNGLTNCTNGSCTRYIQLTQSNNLNRSKWSYYDLADSLIRDADPGAHAFKFQLARSHADSDISLSLLYLGLTQLIYVSWSPLL